MKPSKAQRIRALKAAGHTNQEIAAIIGCRVEYVRACQQDRTAIQRKYEAPIMVGADRDYANEMYRKAYRSARASGMPVKRAKNAGDTARKMGLIRTGRAAMQSA